MTKEKLIHYCISRLHVEDQYRSLVDLCLNPPQTRNPLPDEQTRKNLLAKLVSHGVVNGVAIRASQADKWSLLRDWLKTANRVEKNPDAAITSARALLEKACKEVLHAEGADVSTLKEGDLGQLLKKTRLVLKLFDGTDVIAAGVATIVNGIAEASNSAGDRHGVVRAKQIPVAEARLIADICMALALYVIEQHRVSTAPAKLPSVARAD